MTLFLWFSPLVYMADHLAKFCVCVCWVGTLLNNITKKSVFADLVRGGKGLPYAWLYKFSS